ncbi:hypothetical protein [Bacillus salipaludis]|uniref:hypothetical protein n=1 Tax=Bacillus salipaludis TaxID=2547811 RepID=UPI002E1E72F8|nr:hypothetical protein [Bacillus salipaludis]
MGLITVLKLISFLLFIVFLLLALREHIKVYLHFNKEMKEKRVSKDEYYRKAKKMYFYYIAFVITSIVFGIIKQL